MNTAENTLIPTDQPRAKLTGLGRYQKAYTGKHIRPATVKLPRLGLGWPTEKGEAR